MVLQELEDQVRSVLSSYIQTACRKGLPYRHEVCVEGKLQVTLDKTQVLTVSIKETGDKNAESDYEDDYDNDSRMDWGGSVARSYGRDVTVKPEPSEQTSCMYGSDRVPKFDDGMDDLSHLATPPQVDAQVFIMEMH